MGTEAQALSVSGVASGRCSLDSVGGYVRVQEAWTDNSATTLGL